MGLPNIAPISLIASLVLMVGSLVMSGARNDMPISISGEQEDWGGKEEEEDGVERC